MKRSERVQKLEKLLVDVVRYFTVMDTCIDIAKQTLGIAKQSVLKYIIRGRRFLSSVCSTSNDTPNKRVYSRQRNSSASFIILKWPQIVLDSTIIVYAFCFSPMIK